MRNVVTQTSRFHCLTLPSRRQLLRDLPDIQFSKNHVTPTSPARLRPKGYGEARSSRKLSRSGFSKRLSFPLELGGEYRTRTGDLLRAKQALSQLS